MLKVIKKDKLKKVVQETAPKLPENVVFIAAIRPVKNGQVMAEFVQCRSLAGRSSSMLALLNEGDARFNSGRVTLRAWLMFNPKGFTSTFPGVVDDKGVEVDIVKAAEMAQSIDPSTERVAIFAAVTEINANGVKHPVKIVVKETINKADLPNSVQELLDDPDVDEEIKNRYVLQSGERTGKGGEKLPSELIVDPLGNKIYRTINLSYGKDEDILVDGKKLISDLAKSKSAAGTSNVLANASSALAEE